MTASPNNRTVPSEWRLTPVEPDAVARLKEILRISPLLSAVLARRGFGEPERARAFLDRAYEPLDPLELPGMEGALDVLRRTRRRGGTVAVYGDYDADGILGTAILREALGRFGMPGGAGGVPFYVPTREHGYGLNKVAVRDLAADGVDLLLTVDCGISGVEEVEEARRLGMEVIVTDHHRPPDGPLPQASAVVDPWLSGAGAPGSVLCGAGVALKLAQALLGDLADQWLDLAAVATVADVVPLAGENRGLVSSRLPRLHCTRNPCLRALIEVAGLAGRELTARDLAFGLGPRINALGRMEQGRAGEAVRAFGLQSMDHALPAAREMDRANRRRQAVEEEVLAEARAQLAGALKEGARSLVATGPGWPLGVIGIAAGRLARDHGRPAAVISLGGDGIGRGSARGVPGFDLLRALGGCADVLERFGGHAGAAGFAVRAGRVGDFRRSFAAAVESAGLPEKTLELDGLLSLAAVGEPVVHDLRRLSPFGEGNPEPLLCVPGVVVETLRRVGDGTHLKMTVSHEGRRCEAIAFRIADDLWDTCRRDGPVDLACTPVINEFRGSRSVELQVRAAREARPFGPVEGGQ